MFVNLKKFKSTIRSRYYFLKFKMFLGPLRTSIKQHLEESRKMLNHTGKVDLESIEHV